MKGHMLRNIAFACFIVIFANTTNIVFAQLKESKTINKSAVSIEDVLSEDAFKEFKKVLEKKDGHIQRISCRFKVHKNKPIETIVKSYYSDYHRKPDFYAQRHNALDNLQPDSVFEFIYHKKRTPYVSLVQKDGREKKCLMEKQLNLPAWFDTVS